LITKLAARGVREKDIARAVNVSEPTWIKRKNDEPALRAAFDAGRQVMHDALVSKLFERAMKGDIVPALFLLKVVFGYRENDVPDELRPQVVINIPAALPREEYERKVDRARCSEEARRGEAWLGRLVPLLRRSLLRACYSSGQRRNAHCWSSRIATFS